VIVCIGDSITYGQHLADDSKAWPNLLREGVQAFGVPGDTTRLGLERFPADVQASAPSVVIIQFGHNDANRWQTDRGLNRVSPRAFKANLEEMVERARTFGAIPLLCTLTPSHRSDTHALDVQRYDSILRRVADEEAVRLIDVRSAFLPAVVSAPLFIMEDGLHLTERGHKVYADTVQQVLDEQGLS
jgi:lysophospholipase L1-like esterase